MTCGGGVTTRDPGDVLDAGADASTEAFCAMGSGLGMLELPGASAQWRQGTV